LTWSMESLRVMGTLMRHKSNGRSTSSSGTVCRTGLSKSTVIGVAPIFASSLSLSTVVVVAQTRWPSLIRLVAVKVPTHPQPMISTSIVKRDTVQTLHYLIRFCKKYALFRRPSRENTRTFFFFPYQWNTAYRGLCLLFDPLFRFDRTIPMCRYEPTFFLQHLLKRFVRIDFYGVGLAESQGPIINMLLDILHQADNT